MCPTESTNKPAVVAELRKYSINKYVQSQESLASHKEHKVEKGSGKTGQQVASFEEQKAALQKLWKVKSRVSTDNLPCAVVDGLYIGGISAARNLTSLLSEGVCYVLNASPVVPCMHKQYFKYKVLHVYDDPEEDIAQWFAEANEFIAEGRRQGGVLVHCYAGQSRSAALVMAYLMAECGMSFSTAWNTLKRGRPVARPNVGFMKQLLNYAWTIGTALDMNHELLERHMIS